MKYRYVYKMNWTQINISCPCIYSFCGKGNLSKDEHLVSSVVLFSHVSLVIFNGRDTTQDFLFPVENNFKAFTPAVYFLPHPESPVFVNQTLFSGAAWQWDLHPVATLPWTLMMEVTELYLVMHLHSNEKIQTFFISFYFTPLLIKKRGQYLCIHQCSQYYLTTAVS